MVKLSYPSRSNSGYGNPSRKRNFKGFGSRKSEITSLRDPHSGAPLEPSLEYGDTIMYSPHSGEFVHVSTPDGEVVESRLKQVSDENRRIVLSYIGQSADFVRDSEEYDDVVNALRMLTQAISAQPWLSYPEADLRKMPLYQMLNEAYNMVSIDVQSAKESSGEERKKFLKLARTRILAAEKALKTENSGNLS